LLLDISGTMVDTIAKSLSASQLRKLKRFGSRINKFGVNFAVCDSRGEIILLCEGDKFQSPRQRLIEAGRCALNQTPDPVGGQPVGKFEILNSEFEIPAEGRRVLATVLRGDGQAAGAALIDLGQGPGRTPNPELRTPIPEAIFGEMLELLAENFQAAFQAEQQIEKIGMELAQTYEELVLLHRLSTNMKLTQQDTSFLQMACDSLTEIVCVEGIAILLEKTVEGEKKLVLAAGSGLIDIDERMTAHLYSRLADEINEGREALLDSEVDSPFKYDWPKTIRNIIAVPLCSKEKGDSHFTQETKAGDYIIGLMVAINRVDKQDFDSTDVKLFNSVAGGCAVFIENGTLFRDLKELFIGSLKALTSSIDAKDKYTHGHSERVAFISRWIAERIVDVEPLEQEQIHKIYLSGLLHDIGKIGIDETVLRKQGRLTNQEMEHIRRHPSVGAGILSAIKQMRDIVPGVLCHHERVDGKGYPHGLVGKQIPLIGKIVGLADSFDAMTSKRTYREAMTIKQTLQEIEKQLGTQFDEKVGRVFLDSDVYQLWEIIQNNFSEIYGNSSFSEYGTAAVGVLIR